MDAERVVDAHPAFGQIVSHLSPDEAMILFLLRKRTYRLGQHNVFHQTENRFESPTTEFNEFPLEVLARPELFLVYLSHLQHLDLAGSWENGEREFPRNNEGKQIGLRKTFETRLTEFGRMFARACVPDELPERASSSVYPSP